LFNSEAQFANCKQSKKRLRSTNESCCALHLAIDIFGPFWPHLRPGLSTALAAAAAGPGLFTSFGLFKKKIWDSLLFPSFCFGFFFGFFLFFLLYFGALQQRTFKGLRSVSPPPSPFFFFFC
jgi:hypothetical protein